MFKNPWRLHLYCLRGDPERGHLTWEVVPPPREGEDSPEVAIRLLSSPSAWAVAGVMYKASGVSLRRVWILRNGRLNVRPQHDRQSLGRETAELLARNWLEQAAPGANDSATLERMGRVATAFSLALSRGELATDLFPRMQAAEQSGAALTGHYHLYFVGNDWSLAPSERLWWPRMSIPAAIDDAYRALQANPQAPRAVASVVGGKVSLAIELFANGSRHQAVNQRRADEFRDAFWQNYDHLPRQAWLWGLSAVERNRIVRRVIRNWLEGFVSPAQLAWNGGTVLTMAQRIWRNGQWGDLPVLADALEESGNENQQLLAACRRGEADGAHAVLLAAAAYRDGKL